ncbi:MAG: SpoIIE family protein phosphatase [Spirochaetia bacterium]|nr:SpoIIE family protein phosphatase [Spirochaetia bacterium]
MRRFVDLLSEKAGQGEISGFIANLSVELRNTLKSLETTPWIPATNEADLIEALLGKFKFPALLETVGRDCIVTALSQSIHTLPKECGIEEVIYRIPSFATGFMTHQRITVSREGDIFKISVEPGSDAATRSDILFLHGLIRGLLDVFDTGEYSLILSQSDLSDPLPGQKPASGPCSVFELAVNPGLLSVGARVVTYDAYAQQVLKESARVLQDNRELQTAVEYLNIANRELERTILVNKTELDMARSIQKGFVPSRIPDWNGLQFWVKFFPMQQVSGDFYDYFYLGSMKFGLLVCDVSGHGVPAALISAVAKFSFSNNRLDSPAEVLEKVNQDMINFVRGEGYLTGFYMIVDNHYNLTYSIGAFPNPLIYRARTEEIEFLPGKGTLLGMFPDAGRSYVDLNEILEPGDKIIIFSDGIVEATNVQGESLGEDRLIDAIRETKGMDVQRSSEHIMAVYNRFIRGTDQRDDLTLITVMLSERLDEFNDTMKDARRAYDSGNVQEACVLLKQAISIFPRQTNALFLLGKYLALDGNFEDSLEYLRQYNLLKPYNADAFRIMGYCSYKLGNLETASEMFKRSLGLRWENPSVLYNQVQTLIKLQHLDEARKLFDYFEQFSPGHPLVGKLRVRLNSIHQ